MTRARVGGQEAESKQSFDKLSGKGRRDERREIYRYGRHVERFVLVGHSTDGLVALQ